jgi:type VI secretion system protein ImpA
MPSPETLDFDTLLKPIAGDNPAGVSVRYDGIYDAIQEARRSEDNLPMGDWQRDVKVADLDAVIDLATETISEKSKDLQLATWLVEALLRKHGSAGLRDGIRLLRELQETYWEGLFPEVEEGDLEFRAGVLQWLNEKLPAFIRQIMVTKADALYSWHHWEESRQVDNLGRQNPDAMQAAIAEGKITGEQFDKAVEATPRLFYEDLFETLHQTKDEVDALEKVVDEKFGRAAPSLIAIRKAVIDCESLIAGVVKKKREQDPNYKTEGIELLSENADPTEMGGGERPGGAMSSTIAWSGEPKSREEAFQRLNIIAAYLRRVEPQHPVSYLLERAVRWTQMPLEQWLGEVIHNQDVLTHLRETLGIKDQNQA